jgi:hypothetical protein
MMTPMSPRTLRPYTGFVSPKSIAGLVAWWDASSPTYLFDATSGGSQVAADGAVARWEDRSGSGNHAAQTTTGSRPVRKLAAIGGKDAVRFDGTDDYLHLTTAIGASSFTIAAVMRKWDQPGDPIMGLGSSSSSLPVTHVDNADDGTFCARYDGSGAGTYAGRYPPVIARTTPVLFVCDSSLPAMYVDGVQVATNYAAAGVISGATFDDMGARLGGFGYYAKAEVGEMAVYGRVLTAAERRNVEGYMRRKWSTP